MEESYIATERFLAACDDMLTGKYVAAEGKIGEILKSIASSEELTSFFSSMTDGFDYVGAKREYLHSPEKAEAEHGFAVAPKERREILAFVFCLLVELDGGSLPLSDFLLRYFYEDGSFSSSYEQFVTRMIRPFRDLVSESFPEVGRRGEVARMQKKEAEILDSLSEMIPAERQRIAAVEMGQADKVAGDLLLSELIAATGRSDKAEIRALLCGYYYYLHVVDADSEESNAIFSVADEL